MQFKEHEHFHSFAEGLNIYRTTNSPFILSLTVQLHIFFFCFNYQQIAVLVNDMLSQFHYTNGYPLYHMSFCDVHGHNREREIHLP